MLGMLGDAADDLGRYAHAARARLLERLHDGRVLLAGRDRVTSPSSPASAATSPRI